PAAAADPLGARAPPECLRVAFANTRYVVREHPLQTSFVANERSRRTALAIRGAQTPRRLSMPGRGYRVRAPGRSATARQRPGYGQLGSERNSLRIGQAWINTAAGPASGDRSPGRTAAALRRWRSAKARLRAAVPARRSAP